WSGPSFSYDGRFYKIPELGVHPHPAQGPDLPIWIGGHSRAAIRAAAEHAHGLLTWLASPEQVREIAARLRSLRPAARLAAAIALTGSAGEIEDQARRMREAGADL